VAPSPVVPPQNLVASRGQEDGILLQWTAARYADVQTLYQVRADTPDGEAPGEPLRASGARIQALKRFELREGEALIATLPANAMTYLDSAATGAQLAPGSEGVRIFVATLDAPDALLQRGDVIAIEHTYRLVFEADAPVIEMPVSGDRAPLARCEISSDGGAWQTLNFANDAHLVAVPGAAGQNELRARLVALDGPLSRELATHTRSTAAALASVSAGYAHTCAVRADDKVVCWGIARFESPLRANVISAGNAGVWMVQDRLLVFAQGSEDPLVSYP